MTETITPIKRPSHSVRFEIANCEIVATFRCYGVPGNTFCREGSNSCDFVRAVSGNPPMDAYCGGDHPLRSGFIAASKDAQFGIWTWRYAEPGDLYR